MRLRSLFWLCCVLVVTGCGGSAQILSSTGTLDRYERIAARSVACSPQEEGCNEAHLVRGEACFRLSASGEDRFQGCAVRHLALGVDMTAGDGIPLDMQAYYENLMESLRLRRDSARTREEAAPFAAQLESRARAFRAAFPNAPAGDYYLLSAELKKAADNLETAPALACRALTDAGMLLRALPRDPGNYGPGFDKAESAFEEIRSAVGVCVGV